MLFYACRNEKRLYICPRSQSATRFRSRWLGFKLSQIMRTIETTVYSFNELSEQAKEKAIERLYDINVDYDWWDSTYEDAKNIGLQIDTFDLDRNRHAKGSFNLSAPEIAANILRDHGKDCETYKTAANFLEDHSPIFAQYMDESNEETYESSKLEDELQDLETEFLNSLLEDYSILLQREYEYLTSEAAIIETIEANEYEFTENGKLI